MSDIIRINDFLMNDGEISFSTVQIAKWFKKKNPYDVFKKFENWERRCANLGLGIFSERSEYLDSQGKTQPMIIMDSQTALNFCASFTKDIGIVVIHGLCELVDELREQLANKDKKLLEQVKKYNLSDSAECANLTTICGRFDMTAQAVNKVLLSKGVLKTVYDKKSKIYRLRAGFLGRGLCNIDQDVNDFSTHLKWTDKIGIAFLTEFMSNHLEMEEIKRKEKEFLECGPIMFDLDHYAKTGETLIEGEAV